VQSDAQLVEAVLGGDRASYAILVQRYERAVLGVALGILRDHHDAQDVAQDAFTTAFERLGTLRRPGRFAPWILGIARRMAIDLWHERSKRSQETVQLDGVAARDDGRLNERVEKAFKAIDWLPERQRQVVLYRYCDGLSVREIAEATGSPVGTVTKCLSRALARLRKTLAKESGQ
jgi:RNA polymerase sigma-70 factor (ECF subfamily)